MLNFKKDFDQWGPLDARLLYMSFWFEPAAFGSGRRFGAQWPEIIGLFENFRVTYIWKKKEMEKAGALAIKNIFLKPKKRQELWTAYLTTKTELEVLSQRIETLLVFNADVKTIRAAAVSLVNLIKSMWEIGVTPEVANFGAPAYLENKIKKFIPTEEIADALEVLLAPEDSSFHQQSEKELLELWQVYGGRISKKELEKYAAKWHWLENNYFGSQRLSAEYFGNVAQKRQVNWKQ